MKNVKSWLDRLVKTALPAAVGYVVASPMFAACRASFTKEAVTAVVVGALAAAFRVLHKGVAGMFKD